MISFLLAFLPIFYIRYSSPHSCYMPCSLLYGMIFTSTGARVIMACRDMGKAEEAAKYIRSETEGVEGAGTVETVCLDLASLESVRHCAQELLQKLEKIHLLVNNAGTVCSCFLSSRPASRVATGFAIRTLLSGAFRDHGVSQGQNGGRVRDAVRCEPPGPLPAYLSSPAAHHPLRSCQDCYSVVFCARM
jgi:hypothetical protein